MRYALSIAVGLIFWWSAADASERYTGFMTFGCGDRYIKLRNMPQTWYVDLTAEQEGEIFRLAQVSRDSNFPWLTLHVAVEATRRSAPRAGYFGQHPQQLHVERVISARSLESAESVAAATAPSKLFSGYLLVGPESVGFVPLEQSDEFWWVVTGKVGWEEIHQHFRPQSASSKYTGLDLALVEIVGRVGPPGAYGHLNDFNREIAVDLFKYVRAARVAELEGTAGIQGGDVGVNMCKPQVSPR